MCSWCCALLWCGGVVRADGVCGSDYLCAREMEWQVLEKLWEVDSLLLSGRGELCAWRVRVVAFAEKSGEMP